MMGIPSPLLSIAWLLLLANSSTHQASRVVAFSPTPPLTMMPSWRADAARTTYVKQPKLSTRARTEQDSVDGLMSNETFALYDMYDRILLSLRSHVPYLLVNPLSIESAAELYDRNFQFFVGKTSQNPLISGVDELVAMVLALRVAVTGGNARVFPWPSRKQPDETPESWIIHSDMAFNPANVSESMALSVVWNISVPFWGNQASESNVRLRGRSVLVLAPKVVEHRLLALEINDATIDTSLIDDWLATIRRSLKTLQPLTPGLESFARLTLFNKSKDLQAVRRIERYVGLFFHQAHIASFEHWIPIHQWDGPNPLPGLDQWASYRRKHEAISEFSLEILPALVDGKIPDELFDTQATLVGIDGAVLLQGANKLAQLYSNLAVLRQTSSGTLSILKVITPKDTDETKLEVAVDYVAQIRLPVLSASLTTMRGTDRFLLVFKSNKVTIQSISQVSLDFGEQTGLIDGAWLARLVIASVEAGEPMKWIAAERWVKSSSNTERTAAPRRSERAAVTIFRMMETLHGDFGCLFDVNNLSPLPPASKYASEAIKLRGYLNEVLLDGRPSYFQNLGLLINSVRSAIRSGVLSCNMTSVRVELTAHGRVRCVFVVSLNVSEVLRRLSNQPNDLKLEIITEYQPNDSSGMIDEHLLQACRINGILTPADIVARFLRNRPALEEEDWRSMALEAFQWANSLGGRNQDDRSS